MEQRLKLPPGWVQLDNDGEENIYVHTTDHDPHYYDRSVEIVREEKGWGVYARTGKDRSAKEAFHKIFPDRHQAEKKIIELMLKGF